jgi:hypothetical protein
MHSFFIHKWNNFACKSRRKLGFYGPAVWKLWKHKKGLTAKLHHEK